MPARTRSSDRYKTTDLTMASYLISRGFEPTLEKDGELKPDHPSGVWSFAASDDLCGAVRLYQEDLAKVEPRRFYQTVKDARRRMFKFLGIGQS